MITFTPLEIKFLLSSTREAIPTVSIFVRPIMLLKKKYKIDLVVKNNKGKIEEEKIK